MGLPVHFDRLKDRDPEFYDLLLSLKELAHGPGVLDAKAKYLIGLAINASLERTDKVRCALGQAWAAGATDEEVHEVLRLTYFIKGLSTAQLIADAVK